MDAHAHADSSTGRPALRAERPLHIDRRRHTGARRRKDREERVTLGVYLRAAMCRQGRPDQLVMISKDLRVPVPRRRNIAVEPSMSVKRKVSVCLVTARLPCDAAADNAK
jgi:hypothetical protein